MSTHLEIHDNLPTVLIHYINFYETAILELYVVRNN